MVALPAPALTWLNGSIWWTVKKLTLQHIPPQVNVLTLCLCDTTITLQTCIKNTNLDLHIRSGHGTTSTIMLLYYN